MRSIFRFFWVVPALALGSGLFLGATDEPRSPAKGTVLILRSERTMEGEIQRKNGRYIVKRSVGEIAFPASDVLHLGLDWDDAYDFMRSRIRQDDAEGHLKLAKWCDVNNLQQQALDEAVAAKHLRPDHEKAGLLCLVFEKKLKAHLDAVNNPPEVAPREVTPPLPDIDVSEEAKKIFAKLVQPILLQRCLECHNPNRSTKFQLYRPYEGTLTQATVRNMHAVLMQIDRDRPEDSPLLLKAAHLHGGMTYPPIRGKRDPQFAKLKEWVELVLADHAGSSDWLQRQKRATIAAAPTNASRDRPAPKPSRLAVSEPVEADSLQEVLPGQPVSKNFERIGESSVPSPEVCRLDSGGIRPAAAFGDSRLVSTAFYSPEAERSSVTPEPFRGGPKFPTHVARPRLPVGQVTPILLASGAKELPPVFPAMAASPSHLPRPLREKATALPAPASVVAPGPSFRLHPVPTPMMEAVRPEPATDEFDPRGFNQHLGEQR